ncbi:MAG: FAD-dependent oxidoreductase, partial [Pyrinomonadaceae bacterium]
MSSYPMLFQGFASGRLALTNRLVALAHGTGMIRDGHVTDGDIAYWDRLAQSGVGMMITGGITVDPTSVLRHRNRVEAFDDSALEGLKRRCDAIHAHDVVLLGQLTHLGRESTGGDSDFASSAPSPIRSPRDRFPPHELERDEIAAIVNAFAHTAENLKRAGYDGAEIHGALGYLVAQFLSPATNKRNDEYGGTEEKRLRFLREMIEAIRTRCGDDFLLSLRLSADEEIGDGLEIADSVRIAEAVASYRAVDVLNITMGVRGNYVKDAAAPKGIAARASKLIREASGLPVIVGQRITHPELAERILSDGAADLVGMARALIADPDWVRKAAAGEAERIRPCLG